MSNQFKRAVNVPAGSRVEVEVAPCDSKVVTKAKLIAPTTVTTWDPCLDPDPPNRLEAGKRYFVSVRLFFVQASNVRLEIRFRDPTGGVHSSPSVWKIAGKKGDVELHAVYVERVV